MSAKELDATQLSREKIYGSTPGPMPGQKSINEFFPAS